MFNFFLSDVASISIKLNVIGLDKNVDVRQSKWFKENIIDKIENTVRLSYHTALISVPNICSKSTCIEVQTRPLYLTTKFIVSVFSTLKFYIEII